MLIAIRC